MFNEKPSTKNLLKHGYWIFGVGICIVVSLFFLLPEKNSRDVSGQKPNILLITIDTLRPDYLSTYGFTRHQTENIDKLAKDGTVFDSAYCDVTWTTPSMASTLTGTFCYKHQLRSMYQSLPASAKTVAESLKSAGYNTAAVIGSFPLAAVYKLDQGFDVYDDAFSEAIFVGSRPPQDVESQWGDTVNERKQMFFKKIVNKSRRPDRDVSAIAVRMLEGFSREESNKKPFFLWLHYFGPHDIPDLRLNRLENWKIHAAGYAGKVVDTDKALGDLLSALEASKFRDNTLVIFHADHGESLWEHGFVGHGVYLYEDNLRIPLIMKWPGRIPKGRRVPALVGNIDIAATILDAAQVHDVEMEKVMDGKSLFPVIDKGKAIHDSLYFETYLCAHDLHAEIVNTPDGNQLKVGVYCCGVLRKPWKYIKTGFSPLFDAPDRVIPAAVQAQMDKDELFNLQQDPAELQSMAQIPGNGPMMQNLMQLLTQYTTPGDVDAGKNRRQVTKEQLDKLRSLGYVK
jgi:arylsulfatase A-like enzyme